MTVLLTAEMMRQPFGCAHAASSASSSPFGRGTGLGCDARWRCEMSVIRSPQAQQERRERIELVRLEDAKLGHAVARLDVLVLRDEAHQAGMGQFERVDADRTAA